MNTLIVVVTIYAYYMDFPLENKAPGKKILLLGTGSNQRKKSTFVFSIFWV